MKKDGQLYYLEDLSSVNCGKTMTWIQRCHLLEPPYGSSSYIVF